MCISGTAVNVTGLGLRVARAAVWAHAEQRQMTIGQAIPATPLQIPIEMVYGVVVDFDARAALAADQVVMRVLRNLIHKVLLRIQSWLGEAVAGQELESAVDSGLSQTAGTAAGSLKNLRGR